MVAVMGRLARALESVAVELSLYALHAWARFDVVPRHTARAAHHGEDVMRPVEMPATVARRVLGLSYRTSANKEYMVMVMVLNSACTGPLPRYL